MSKISIKLGQSEEGQSDIRVTPEQIFGCHCAILGSSGSGKSWSMALCLQEAARLGGKVLLIDLTGEYKTLQDRTFHIHIPSGCTSAASISPNSVPATVPYFELTESDLFSIFAPETPLQTVKLRGAIRTLKLVQCCPRLAVNGVVTKANKLKAPFEEELAFHSAMIDRSDSIFNVFNLPNQISLECVEPCRGEAEQDYWGRASITEQLECAPLIHRIEDIIKQGKLNCIFNPPAHPSVFEALEKFLTDPSVSILRISLEELPLDHEVRPIVAEAIARTLLAMGRHGELNQMPIVLAIDEAHQIISEKQTSPQTHVDGFSIFNSIAREGRKYGLTLCLATQRPSDIPDGILTQCSFFLVHRMVGERDITSIQPILESLEKQPINMLSKLPRGTAVCITDNSQITVKMSQPPVPPISCGPNYQQAWGAGGSNARQKPPQDAPPNKHRNTK